MPRILTDLTNFPNDLRGGALAIGNFDAVHRGHAELLRALVTSSRRISGAAIVFTFDPPPAKILRPALPCPAPLTWIERRAAIMGELGVDAMIAYPTNPQLLNMGAADFFREIVVDRLAARAMVEGPNFFFGKDRHGDIHLLKQLCHAQHMQLEIVAGQLSGTALVSSSKVRELIGLGQVGLANRLLIQPYRLRGLVTAAQGRGRQLGFPTANLCSIPVLLPAEGVYAGRVHLQGTNWPAAVNIGPNPTFSENRLKVEVHIVGWTQSLYQQWIEVELLDRVRDVQKFPSQESLVRQLHSDVATCVQLASAEG